MTTKRKTSFLALVLAMAVLCMGLMSGCSDSSEDADSDTEDTSAETSSSTTEEDAAEVEEDVIGEVTYIGASSYFSIDVYTSAEEIEDYAAVDVADLTEEGSTDYIYVDNDTEYYIVESGSLVSAEMDDVTVGSIIAGTTSDDGVLQVIILSAGSAEAIDADVVEVTDIGDDGVISFDLYALTEEASEYEITDAAAVELSNYEVSADSGEYTVMSTDIISVSDGVTATETDSSEIAVGDMLVIYEDADTGYTAIVIYHE